jgi:hypothetical protein
MSKRRKVGKVGTIKQSRTPEKQEGGLSAAEKKKIVRSVPAGRPACKRRTAGLIDGRVPDQALSALARHTPQRRELGCRRGCFRSQGRRPITRPGPRPWAQQACGLRRSCAGRHRIGCSLWTGEADDPGRSGRPLGRGIQGRVGSFAVPHAILDAGCRMPAAARLNVNATAHCAATGVAPMSGSG